MSDGDRGSQREAARSRIAQLIRYFWRKRGDNEPNNTNEGQQRYGSGYEEINNRKFPFFIESVNNGWHADEREHRKREKSFWGRTLVLAFVTTIAAILGACFAFGAYQQAKRQANVAQDAQRPWIVLSNIQYREDVESRKILLVYKNVGHTTASRMIIDAHELQRGETDVASVRGQCASPDLRKLALTTRFSFPPETDWSVALNEMPSAVGPGFRHFPLPNLKVRKLIVLVGCVLYRSPYDTDQSIAGLHQAGYIAAVFIDPQNSLIKTNFIYTIDAD